MKTRCMPLRLAFVISAVGSVFCLGASGANSIDLNSYANLPCATVEQFSRLTETIKLVKPPEGALCDDSFKARLGKLLLLMEKLNVTVGPDWKGGADVALSSPLDYVKKMNLSVSLDLTQKSTIAYNSSKKIFLGALFFKESPLDSINTLIHESRHSDSKDPKHDRCRYGDIPKSRGGCDEWFRTDDTSGAYAYGVSFGFGLAKYNTSLSDSDRKFLIADALSTIGTRFNFVPPVLSTPHEILIGLDDEGRCYLIHPFVKKGIPIECRIPDEKVTRIESKPSKKEILLYTDSKQVYSWNPNDAALPEPRFNGRVVPRDTKIREVESLNAGENTLPYFISEDNQIFYLERNPANGETEVRLSRFQPHGFQAMRLVLGGINRRYVVDERGDVYYFGENSKLESSPFQARRGWEHVSPGVTFDFLFGVGRDGGLYYRSSEETEIKVSSFVIPTKSKKFIEGATLRVQLDTTGNVYVARQGESKFIKLINQNLVKEGAQLIDVALVRQWSTPKSMESDPSLSESFIKECDIVTGRVEPWTGHGVGIDKSGRLVFEGSLANPCYLLESAEEGLGEDLTGVEIGGTVLTDENKKFSQSHLLLKKEDGSQHVLWSY